MKMKFSIIIFLCLLLSCFLTSCDKAEKVGKLEIVDVEFIMNNEDSENAGALNVIGKVKNISPYDAKNVVITGSCKECSEVMSQGSWFSTKNKNYKSSDQSAVIPYITAGNTETFKFRGIAFWFKTASQPNPPNNLDGLEVFVESFETVQE